jgi:hypothetical protein
MMKNSVYLSVLHSLDWVEIPQSQKTSTQKLGPKIPKMCDIWVLFKKNFQTTSFWSFLGRF